MVSWCCWTSLFRFCKHQEDRLNIHLCTIEVVGMPKYMELLQKLNIKIVLVPG